MFLFKKRVSFPQFLGDLISAQCDLLERHFDKIVVMADEFNALTKEDKQQFFEKAHALVIIDIMMRCGQCFSENVSMKEVGN